MLQIISQNPCLVYGVPGTYNNWSDCQPNNKETRTVSARIPAGCAGGSPVLERDCIYNPPAVACASFTYSGWSACSSGGERVRSVVSRLPEGCAGGSPETTEECAPSGGEDKGEKVAVISDKTPLKVGGEKQVFGKADKFYSDSKKISFSGETDEIKNGKVKIYEGGKVKKEVKVEGDGEWKASVKVKKNNNYDFVVRYYNSEEQEAGESKKYTVKVDTKEPEFTDLPLFLTKKRGDKIWWKAKDNRDIDYFKWTFLGRVHETEKYSLIVPANAPTGVHILKVKAYDKAGNSKTRIVTILIR